MSDNCDWPDEIPDGAEYFASRGRIEVYWRDRFGKMWLIQSMADSHIVNALHLMERNEWYYEQYLYDQMMFVWMVADDDHFGPPDPDQFDFDIETMPMYQALRSEVKRRKIEYKPLLAIDRSSGTSWDLIPTPR